MVRTESIALREQPQPDVEKVVAGLHEFFCEHSKRREPLRFFQRQWYDLLVSPEYNRDATALRRDVGFVIWYLRKQIGAQKRNPGCLKLINFLEPQQFLADLAEACEQFAKAYRAHCFKCSPNALPEPKKTASRPAELPATQAEEERMRTEAKEGLRALREQLGFPSLDEVAKLKSANPQRLLGLPEVGEK